MAVQTMNTVESFRASVTAPQRLTYSVAPIQTPVLLNRPSVSPEELEAFLQAENPLGCIRGVMWVMAFNAAVFLLGFTIWQSCKYLF